MLTNNFWETITPSILIEKATGYLPIPGLGSINFTTGGVPFIVAQFIYQASNNFCIPAIPSIDTVGAYFNLAIRYNDPKTGQPIRYKFWDLAGSAMEDIPAPLYTGQMIVGTNFAIEVWSQGALNMLQLPFGLLLATSVKQAIQSLTDVTTFQLGTVSQCSSLDNTSLFDPSLGFALPMTFLPCAAAQYTGQQTGTLVSITGQVALPSIPVVGTNYRFNMTTGALELLNVTTSKYNPIVSQGTAGTESIVIEPQD
jgi:hypothetical protein